MKLSGSATLDAPVARVWDALRDPEVLVRTIPGCERLETVGEDAYKMTVTAGVASIKGTYVGEVALTEPEPPRFVVLRARGQGAPGTIDATVRVRLSEAGDAVTRIDYDADATVGGMIGGVGQRMLITVAKKTAGEFFADVNSLLAGADAGVRAMGAAANGVPAAAGAASGALAATAVAPAGPGPGAAAAGAVPAGSAASGSALGGSVAGGSGIYTAPAPPRSGDSRQMVGAFAAGGAIALAGVFVGWLLGRRTRR